ncbi:MAG: MFS transporter, partial [Verrucomicrobiota bacterium]
LWILDASINISMEPFRALVADLLPEEQRPFGFSVQTLLIGLGAVVSSALPWILTHGFGVSPAVDGPGRIPSTVRLAFYLGAAVLLAAVVWTILTTREHPPADLEAFQRMKAARAGLAGNLREIAGSIGSMPARMWQLGMVQLFTWAGLFCMWTYFGPAVARTVFGAARAGTPEYIEGTSWGGVCFSVYNGVALLMAFVLIGLSRRVSPRRIHTVGLLCGGLGLISVLFVRDRYLLFGSMAGVGVAWACILSMPYAMLAGALPEEKMGTYMGVFNFFIVIPQVVVALASGWVLEHVFRNQVVALVVSGGVCLVVAALLVQRVQLAPSSAPAGARGGRAP